MANKVIRTIGVLTSGGDAQGMNPCIRAVTRYALNQNVRVKGILKGYSGLLSNEIIDLTRKDLCLYQLTICIHQYSADIVSFIC